jgi:hypothetical protein
METYHVFEHPNMEGGFQCPLCKASKDAPVVLVGIPGTEVDGIIEANQVHSECYALFCKMHDIEVILERKRCNAEIYHGPGHQSRTKCQILGEHTIHRAIYGSYDQEAIWKDRKDGKYVCTGCFDEPPEEPEIEEGDK